MKRGLLTARLISFVLCAILLCPILIGCGNSGETFSITYRSYLTPMEPITDSRYTSYNSAKGLRDLPNPVINNYVFLGWYTDEGEEVREILPGTTGDIVLNAYFCSKRNIAKAVEKLEDPIVMKDMDNNALYFVFELGTIENVPLSDEPFWSVDAVFGLSQKVADTYTRTTTEEHANTIADMIAKATVDSSTWTMSSDWENVTTVNEEWAKEKGMSQEEALEKTKSGTGTISVNNAFGAIQTDKSTDQTTTVTYGSSTQTKGESAEFDVGLSANYTNKVTAGAEVSADGDKLKAGYENGVEVNGSIGYNKKWNDETVTRSGTDETKVETEINEDTFSWNSNVTRSSTMSASETLSVKQAISEVVAEKKGYGKTYVSGGGEGKKQDYSTSENKSTTSSSTVSYIASEEKTTTTEYSTDGKIEGHYRSILAGTFHVFGVVGYDTASKSFFTYTYSVLDDKTYEFLDYSPSKDFKDYETSVLPFEIPYDVYEYVQEKMACTKGVEIVPDTSAGTAKVTSFVNTTEKQVVVPSYYTSGGIAYRVTEISAKAFAGKDIESIILGDYIEALPAGAFKNCNKLKQVSGCFTVIGDEAFYGCTSLENFTVSDRTTAIGIDAFKDVPCVNINVLSEDAALAKAEVKYLDEEDSQEKADKILADAKAFTQKLVENIAECGAKKVVVDISNSIKDATMTINVGDDIEVFELIGGKKENKLVEHQNLRVKSEAGTTILRELSIKGDVRIPLEIASGYVTLDVVHVQSESLAMVLSANEPVVTLIRDSKMTSVTGKAILCKKPQVLSEKFDGSYGILRTEGDMYVNGTDVTVSDLRQNGGLAVNGEIKKITNTEFEQLHRGTCVVIYNTNGDPGSIPPQTYVYGEMVALPYYQNSDDSRIFIGWSKNAASTDPEYRGGQKITFTEDTVLYAIWEVVYLSDVSLNLTRNPANITISKENTILTTTVSEYNVSEKLSAFVGAYNDVTKLLSAEVSTGEGVFWSSSNPSVVAVDSKGVVTALKTGTAIITVKTQLGAAATCAVTVTNSNNAVIWSSSDTSVATVIDGTVTAVGRGEATITAKTESGARAVCTVKVYDATKAIALTDKSQYADFYVTKHGTRGLFMYSGDASAITGFAFGFVTGNTAPNGGVLYQCKNKDSGIAAEVYFTGNNLVVMQSYGNKKSEVTANYALEANTFYRIEIMVTNCGSNATIRILDRNGELLHTTSGKFSLRGSDGISQASIGPNSNIHIGSSPNIHLTYVKITGTQGCFDANYSKTRTYECNYADQAIGATKFVSGELTANFHNTGVQWYYW